MGFPGTYEQLFSSFIRCGQYSGYLPTGQWGCVKCSPEPVHGRYTQYSFVPERYNSMRCHTMRGAVQEENKTWRLCYGIIPDPDGRNEEFASNEGWLENHQHPALVAITWSGHRGGRTWQWQHVVVQIYPVDGRLRVYSLTDGRFQQRCQAYRVQAGSGLVCL